MGSEKIEGGVGKRKGDIDFESRETAVLGALALPSVLVSNESSSSAAPSLSNVLASKTLPPPPQRAAGENVGPGQLGAAEALNAEEEELAERGREGSGSSGGGAARR